MEVPDHISQCGLLRDFMCWLNLQVRSLTLDVRVWEPSVISYFQAVGNAYANTIWEEQLTADGRSLDESRCAKTIYWFFFISLHVLLHFSKSNSFCEVLFAEGQTTIGTDLLLMLQEGNQIPETQYQSRKNLSRQRFVLYTMRFIAGQFIALVAF